MPILLYAFLAGFFEATFFFIIPDVFLSYLALYSLKGAVMGSLSSLLGALLGGSLMYFYANKHPYKAENFLLQVPAISKNMLEEIKERYKSRGPIDLLSASLRGIPYKIYAVYAAILNYRYLRFFFLSIPARLFRFLFTCFVTVIIAQTLCRNWDFRAQVILLSVVWMVFYSLYFILIYFKFYRRARSA